MDFEQASTPTHSVKPFEFTGKASEFFGIWIVNILLTILTLGIYSAWAKVRTNQYFYGNTQLDGASFQYLATPMQILKSRAIAALLFMIYYAINGIYPLWGLGFAGLIAALIPAIIVMSMTFRMRHTAYRNVAFGFKRNFKQAYLVYAGPVIAFGSMMMIMALFAPEEQAEVEDAALLQEQLSNLGLAIGLITLVSALLFPFWEYLKSFFYVSNTRYGATFLAFHARPREFYGIYLQAFLLSIAVAVGIGLLVFGASTLLAPSEGEEASALATVLPSLLIMPFYLWFFAFIQTKRTNLIYSNAQIGDAVLDSQLSVNYMFYLYLTNTLGILLSLGLLIPWAMIRTAKYRASTITLTTETDLDQFVAQQEEKMSAFGEEFGEVFDIDVGL